MASWYLPQFVASGGKPWFYQQEFGPAVMEGCGLGYVNPDSASRPALTAFLNRKADDVSCGDVASVATKPLTSMQRAFRYLIMTVGETWKLRGHVAWSSLTPLYGFLYGLTIVLAYAILRQGMDPAVSAVVAVALIASTLQLNNLPHLRDYAKAPFVLALVLTAMRLVLPAAATWRTLGLAALAGLLTGVGVGFRNDLLVAIPAFLAVFALFLPGGFRETLKLRASAIAIYVVTVYIAMWPMSSVYTTGGGNSTQHLVLLGLTPAFSADLGVDNSRLYEVGFEYRDELALAIIDNYADRHLAEHRFLPMYGADYDRTATRYLIDVATTFPADLLARVYASAVRITELPHSTMTAALVVPEFLPSPVKSLLLLKANALRWLGTLWPWPLVFTLAALSIFSVRLGLFAAMLVFYLSGYPAIQFQERHFFHLEFVGWWTIGFPVAIAARAAWALLDGQRRAAWLKSIRPDVGWLRAVGFSAAVWVGLALVIAGPLWLLRQYQQRQVRALLTAIAQAPRTDLDLPTLVRNLPADGGVHAAYLVADIGGSHCDAMKVGVTQRYHAMSPGYDFTHTVDVPVPLADTPTRLVFPAYFRNPGSTSPVDEPFGFTGLELPAVDAACLVRVSAVNDPSAFPMLLDLRLRPDWDRATPYATISGVEPRMNPAEVYTVPETLSRSSVKRSLAAMSSAFVPADILKVSPTFRMDGAAWSVAGAGGVGGRGPLLYLVEMKPRHLQKGTTFVAQGSIEKGGVTFGMVRNDQWAVQLHVVQTGDFSVVITVPEDGDYKVIMANNLRGMSLENRVTVRRAGLVMPGGGA